MIKDTSLLTQLTFAVLPIVIPINPRSGRVVKATKRAEVTAEDPEIARNKELEREIDPWKKYIVKEKLEVFVLENETRSSLNSNGYYVFLNLPQLQLLPSELPQPIGYTLFIECESYLSSKHFIDMEQFNSDTQNRSVVAYLFEKKLLKNTEKGSLFIKSIITYPSKKTIFRVLINKARTDQLSENHFEKPIQNAVVRLRKSSGSEVELTPNSVSLNAYVFSSFDEIEQAETVEGTYDESNTSILGERNFIKFPDQEDAKFLLTTQQEGSSEDSTADRPSLEIKIEKAMTTSINVLIVD